MERDAVRRCFNGPRAAERRNVEPMQRKGPMPSEASFLAAMGGEGTELGEAIDALWR